MYEFGKVLHVGVGFTGIIFYENETQVYAVEDNGNSKVFYKDSLNRMIKAGVAEVAEREGVFLMEQAYKHAEYFSFLSKV